MSADDEPDDLREMITAAHPQGCNCADCALERKLAASIKTGKRAPAPRKAVEPVAAPSLSPDDRVDLSRFVDIKPLDDALLELFTERGIPRSGGASGHGWSTDSVFQACPYRYWMRNLAPAKVRLAVVRTRSPALEIGALWHQLLAFRYLRMLDRTAETIDDGELRDELLHRGCSAEVVMEAYRLLGYYESRWENDYLRPIAVEVRHEWRGKTCRYDLVAEVGDDNADGLFPGTYIVEHKTTSRFDVGATEGWKNDGEVLGQEMIWHGSRLDRKYGRLAGVIVNIESKVKLPEFRRIVLPPRPRLARRHMRDLELQSVEERLYAVHGVWPRRRNACLGRYGLCEYADHCAEE